MLFGQYAIDVRVDGDNAAVAIYRRPFPSAPRWMSSLLYASRVAIDSPLLSNGGEVVQEGGAPLGPLLSSPLVRKLFPAGIGPIGIGAREVEQIVHRVARDMTTSRRSSLRWLVRAFALLGAFYVVTTLIAGARTVRPAIQAPVAAVAPAATELQAVLAQGDSSGELAQRIASQMPKLSLDQAAAESAGFDLSAGKAGPKLVVWSDPACPHCRDLEAEIEKLPADIAVTIIPVSFQPNSRILAGYTVCGGRPDAMKSRWTQLMSPQPTADLSQICVDGFKAVDRNSTWFVRAGLNATPTIAVLRGNELVRYAGDVTTVKAADLVQWAKG